LWYKQTVSLADQYRAQYAWRNWTQAYEKLPIKSSHFVLDLGCSIGDQTADLARRCDKVLGIDSNPEFISTAQERRIPNSRFIQADLADWEDPSLAADGLWSSFTAAYFPNFEPVLRRWLSSVRGGGWIALTEIDDLLGHRPLGRLTQEKISHFYKASLDGGGYDFLMGRKLRKYAETCGLEVISESCISDHELAFTGPCDPAVKKAWSERFDRMGGFKNFLKGAYEPIRSELLDCLSAPDHESTARVILLVARKPGVAGSASV